MKPSILVTILVVARDPIPLVNQIGTFIEKANIHATNTGLEGLFAYQKRKPLIAIIDNDLPDLRGESVASIIKDTENGADTIVYLINDGNILSNTKADHFICAPINEILFAQQLQHDLEKLTLLNSRTEEIEKAVAIQRGMLPPRIVNSAFEIDNLISPYHDLSGDGMFYWYHTTDNRDALYGFLFDCTGHDLSSYGQARSLWVTLRRGLTFYEKGIFKSLANVIQSINDETIEYQNTDEPNMSAVIIFMLDLKNRVLRYSPAGNPEILVRRNGEMESINLKSPPLGFDKDIEYKEDELPLAGIQEIILSSDGLIDLLLANFKEDNIEMAKTDDVLAIFIRLK